MEPSRTTYILPAFLINWSKKWNLTMEEREGLFDITNTDLFNNVFWPLIESKKKEQYNKTIAELFGTVITKVKAFPVKDGTWTIIDKHTKYMLHKDIKNENEVNLLCNKNNYVR